MLLKTSQGVPKQWFNPQISSRKTSSLTGLDITKKLLIPRLVERVKHEMPPIVKFSELMNISLEQCVGRFVFRNFNIQQWDGIGNKFFQALGLSGSFIHIKQAKVNIFGRYGYADEVANLAFPVIQLQHSHLQHIYSEYYQKLAQQSFDSETSNYINKLHYDGYLQEADAERFVESFNRNLDQHIPIPEGLIRSFIEVGDLYGMMILTSLPMGINNVSIDLRKVPAYADQSMDHIENVVELFSASGIELFPVMESSVNGKSTLRHVTTKPIYRDVLIEKDDGTIYQKSLPIAYADFLMNALGCKINYDKIDASVSAQVATEVQHQLLKQFHVSPSTFIQNITSDPLKGREMYRSC